MDRHKSSTAITARQDDGKVKAGQEAIQGVIARSLKRSMSGTDSDDWVDSDDHEDSDDDDED